ncbi:MAG: fatty acyl-AMP ligase [Pseudomonadota bacterium]
MSVIREAVSSTPRVVKGLDQENAEGPTATTTVRVSAAPARKTGRADAVALEPTPTQNASLPLRTGGFKTIIEGLEYAARGDTGYNFYSVRGVLNARLPYRELRDRACALAHKLANRFERGSRICMVAETRPDFVVAFYACQYAGMVPAPMPMPVNLGGKDGYIIQLTQMISGAKAAAVIGPLALSQFLAEAVDRAGIAEILHYEDLAALPDGAVKAEPFSEAEPCYIQYSSGSTSAPKGVIGTQQSVTSNLDGIVIHGLRLTELDRAVTWLPLYHDMGLIGFVLSPMFGQRSVDMLATSDFVRRPLMWLTLISKNKGTITYSPSFGYDLAAKRARSADHDHLDLSSWRVAGIGGDMVRPEALNIFAEIFGPCGFARDTFTPSYGLAESTLAIAFSDLTAPFGLDRVDMQHLNRSGIAQPVSAITAAGQERAFVKCGRALPGHEIAIRGEAGEMLADRAVGRVFIKGPSLTAGYFSDPEASAAMFDGEWLDTGDMGYMLDDDLVITGRAKDLIIINGRNIWPQDIEWATETVESVRQGGVAAFSIDDGSGERIVVVAECRGGLTTEQREGLRRDIAQVIQAAAGAPAEIVLVRPHSMVMTSSGKLSRAKVRQRYLNGDFSARDNDGAADEASRTAIAK